MDGRTRYAAVFTLADTPSGVAVPRGSIGAVTGDRVREVWTTGIPHDRTELSVELPVCGAALLRLTPPGTPVD
ncbi:hypothetical protein [Streptomyces sp. S.PB5]|uniref:hypothetical protein n=1 Tax=Streptomyces sp. S.PB5 TaxID=3020844 RepID=UPI0025B27BF5|nr:hypothetical protein [Streptomyces sp. S.PB5]MDN3028036.1 hypothetical protein [Streptomyces sp. S.PB5]